MRVVLFANTDWYLYNFRLGLAQTLRARGIDVLLLSPPGFYGERLRDAGFRWEPVPMERRSLNPLREALLLWHLVRLLRREQIDLVHGFTIKCAVYGSIAARLAGVPAQVNAVAGMGYVFTSNALRARLLRVPLRFLMRFALDGRSSRLILQNPDDADLFGSTGLVDVERIRLIPGSGVDCTRFRPARSKRRVEADALKVLLPTRLLWDKGLQEFVDAAQRLLAEGREIRFLVAGTPDPGNPASVPAQVVQRWIDEGAIEWLGHVEDMAGLMTTVDVVALPSYREGLPKCLIEGAACGLPLIATNVPGCREVVTDGETGLLIPVRDAEALAAAISRLDDDPALRHRLGAGARARALERFADRVIVDATLDVYRELSAIPG